MLCYFTNYISALGYNSEDDSVYDKDGELNLDKFEDEINELKSRL